MQALPYFAGALRPAEDVPLPSGIYSLEESAATTELLFIADLVNQFSKPLKLKAVPFPELMRFAEGKFNPAVESQEAVWDLYQALLRQTRKARPQAQ